MLRNRVAEGIAVTVFVPGLLTGCSGVEEIKDVLQEVSTTLTQIVTLSLSAPEGSSAERLQAAEDRILEACREVLETAHHSFEKEAIPLKTQVGASMTARHCERIVAETRTEVEKLRAGSLSPQH